MLGEFVTLLLRPPAIIIGFVGRPLYRLLFSRSDERHAKLNEEKLGSDIQAQIPFLFSEMNGRIVPNEGVEFPPPFDYAIVTVEMPHFLLKFTRGRDHLAVQAAPKSAPTRFHELTTILTTLEVPGVQRGQISGLSDAARILRQHADVITHALSDDEYPRLRIQLDEVYARDRVIRKQLETELNRKLYG